MKKQQKKIKASKFDQAFEKGTVLKYLDLKTIALKAGLKDARQGKLVKAEEDFSKSWLKDLTKK